jgi:hypothetical protein
MGIIFHKKPHGGRYDDPHGVTAPPTPTGRVKISSEPSAPTKESRKAAKKSQKAIEKSGINDPAYRAASAKRGKQYTQAKKEENMRLDSNVNYKSQMKPAGTEKAYLEGGFEGVDEYQKENPLYPWGSF